MLLRLADPHSLVLVVDLLLGQRGLGVLLQMMADPVERVHLLGAAGRHGALFTVVVVHKEGKHCENSWAKALVSPFLYRMTVWNYS